MTVIATDGRVMAADGLIVDGDTIVSTQGQKLRRLSDGSVIGVAGEMATLDQYAAWMEGGRLLPPDVEKGTEALVLGVAGSVSWLDHRGRFLPAPSRAAIGSGKAYALAAMDAGAGALHAVAIACGRDPWCGGQMLELAPGTAA